jgi:hypothetical protein
LRSTLLGQKVLEARKCSPKFVFQEDSGEVLGLVLVLERVLGQGQAQVLVLELMLGCLLE